MKNVYNTLYICKKIFFSKNFMKQKNASLKAFTLVEMFVVVVILSILWIIGFFAFSEYVSSARDSSRNTTLTEISNSLNTFAASETLPVPDSFIRIEASWSLIWYQGYVWTGVKNEIHFVDDAIDPKLKMPYSYYLSADKKKIQLLGFFEKPLANADLNLFSQTYAAWFYESYYPKIYGDKLGILLSSDSGSMNTPVQEISALKSAGKLDIVQTNSGFTALIDIDEKITGTGAKISQILPNGSCKRIKQLWESKGNGQYTINPGGNGNIQVYCDMETDGGGWTQVPMSKILFTLTNATWSFIESSQWALTVVIRSLGSNSWCWNQTMTDFSWYFPINFPWILYKEILYSQKFQWNAACWRVLWNKYPSYPNTNIDSTLSKIDFLKQNRMWGINGNNFIGNTNICNNETSNFWHVVTNSFGTWERLFTVKQNIVNSSQSTYFEFEAGCTSPWVGIEISNLSIR